MARVRAAALGAALLEAALGQCPAFGRRNYYAEHCEIITYDAASGFAYAWLNAGPCVAGLERPFAGGVCLRSSVEK